MIETVNDVPLSVAEPVEPNGAGVVVVQEAFGVNTYVEHVCSRLAADGYLAVAPHLFHRSADEVISYDDIPAALKVMGTLTATGILDDVDAALARLAVGGVVPARAGIVGFCMGGTVALFTATQRDIGAAVTFYGGGVTEARFEGVAALVDVAPQLRAPWLGLYGDLDQGIPVADVEALRAAAAAAPVETEVVRYAEAGHGFHTHERTASYHEASAFDAWARTLDWFAAHLTG